MVADVQADLVSAFWLPRYRPGVSDATALIAECGEELMLPGGHVATVLRRLGYVEEAAAFLTWHIANGRANDKRRKAGRASAETQSQGSGAMSASADGTKIRKRWARNRTAG